MRLGEVDAPAADFAVDGFEGGGAVIEPVGVSTVGWRRASVGGEHPAVSYCFFVFQVSPGNDGVASGR